MFNITPNSRVPSVQAIIATIEIYGYYCFDSNYDTVEEKYKLDMLVAEKILKCVSSKEDFALYEINNP